MAKQVLLNVIAMVATSIFLTIVGPSVAHAAFMAPKEYEAIRKASVQVLAKASPIDHVYVGIGRSPTPFVSFLKTAGFDACQIPLSKAEFVRAAAESSSPDQAIVDAHFKLFLEPIIAKAHGRKLLLMDYAVNGGFKGAIQLIEAYIARFHPKVEIDYLAFTTRTSFLGRLGNWLPTKNVILLDDLALELEWRLRKSGYDELTDVPSWTTETGELKASARNIDMHRHFITEMNERVSQDVEFQETKRLRFGPAAKSCGQLLK